ncbi:hypothetical protein BpHYR1_013711 [Brachionus plicatilis]|uniref:Uncharacterized protein n=1 Tax=Brachionus plicatilis TaxID=10195 RepID=A0A3M7QCC1_BRAPC|nr:hypothetical protein BpHYR1_013711 [Brachionus plicatilis]
MINKQNLNQIDGLACSKSQTKKHIGLKLEILNNQSITTGKKLRPCLFIEHHQITPLLIQDN